MSKNPLSAAIGHFGTQRALAAALGTTQAAVSQWVRRGRPIPVRHIVEIERVTGGRVRREQLRPDLFVGLPHVHEETRIAAE
jgi:DNA-binding transcriptional regulator YdaS (Cro superfamily)